MLLRRLNTGSILALLRHPGQLLGLSRGNLEVWASLIIIAWAVAFILLQGVGFAVTLGTVFGIWAILAVSLNLVVGYTGLLSVGHIGFFGIGAYAMAILTSNASTSSCGLKRYRRLPCPSSPRFR